MSQPTMLMVSKAHQQNVKRLYKIIFRLHKSMPDELREMGNAYVRSEFKLHKNAAPEHVKIFMNEWSNYTKTLMRQVNPKYGLKFGAPLEDRLDELNDNQVTQLYELFLEATKSERIDAKQNPPSNTK